MLILAKYKDYYDYYQGIFGIDKTKVYDRRDSTRTSLQSESDDSHVLYVCIANKEYTLHFYKGKMYYYPENIVKMNELYNKHQKEYNMSVRRWWRRNSSTDLKYIKKTWKPYENTDKNFITRKPVIAYWYLTGMEKKYFTPLLKDLDFHKIMDAKEAYIQVETFLGWLVDNPPLPDTQTNEGKVIGAGFDLKKSFRHRKD